MVIQCEQCRTKFRLDDEKVSERGVKVRCAKCRHVFTVRKEQQPAADSAEPAVAAAPAGASFDLGQTDAASDSDFDFGDVSFTTETAAAAAHDATFSDKTMIMPAKATREPVVDPGFDFGEAPASSTPVAEPVVEFDFGDLPKGAAVADDPGLTGFDFGDVTAPAAAPQVASFDLGDLGSLADAAPATATRGNSQGFSFDDAVPQPDAASADSFDLSGVDFTRSEQPAPATTPAVASFSLDDVDLSADATQIAVDASATASSGTLFEPVDEAVASRQVAAAPDITFDLPAEREDAPPLTISSRKRQSSAASILIAVVAVVVVAVLGFVAYTFISNGPKALSLLGSAPVPAEEGKITIQNVKAYFIPTSASGELLVITGEALNTYKKPRAALQVKGVVFGASNQPVATRTVYAGNMLTREQLQEMSVDKIEAAMNNQFGDSLANMEVLPGKAIPFAIVIINPPADGKEFTVEPVGSTVAASSK